MLNSADLFRLDLNGIQVLVPAVLSALEVVLPEKDLKLKSNIVSKPDLRRASIHLLISMLTLPLHFQVNIYIILLLQNLLLFNKLSFCNLT